MRIPDSHAQEVIMKHNVGGIDRIGRIVIGAVLLAVGALAPVGMSWRIVALVIAAIALVTAFVRFCPANALLGINTCKSDEKK
jgi:Inner membrane protein YgaP-like, transmembrane domain